MRVEKINDNQIKFFINHSELLERDISISDLNMQNEKLQSFFHEMLDTALYECDFDGRNTPLLVEALPQSADTIIVIVTKINSEVMKASDTLTRIHRQAIAEHMRRVIQESEVNEKQPEPELVLVYSFNNIDTATAASAAIHKHLSGEDATVLYKYDGLYYLHVELTSENGLLSPILSEYGQKHISSYLSSSFLIEHGETLIARNAVSILSSMH